MKKIIAVILSMLLTFSLVACVPLERENENVKSPGTIEEIVPEEKEDELTGWKKAYMDYIVSNKDVFLTKEYLHINYIGLNDLNFDGVPELIISDGSASAGYSVCVLYAKDETVNLLCGFNMFADRYKPSEFDFRLYSNFDDNWLTLRKNKNTGEMRYIMYTHNGSDSSSFGNIISFGAAKDGGFDIKNEFQYDIFYDYENDYAVSEETLLVSEKPVSRSTYDSASDKFEKQWIDTGVRTCAMTTDFSEYSNKRPTSLEKEDLKALFDSYQKEY